MFLGLFNGTGLRKVGSGLKMLNETINFWQAANHNYKKSSMLMIVMELIWPITFDKLLSSLKSCFLYGNKINKTHEIQGSPPGLGILEKTLDQ